MDSRRHGHELASSDLQEYACHRLMPPLASWELGDAEIQGSVLSTVCMGRQLGTLPV